IRAAVDRPKIVLMAAIGTLVLGGVAFTTLGREFIPTLDEGDIAMQALRVPSASLEQSLAMQMALERVITAQPEVETVFSRTGTAEAAVDPMPRNISDSVIILKDRGEWPDPGLEKEALIERIEEAAGQQIGNNFEFSQPIELRFNELISGVRTDLAVLVYGDDFDTLQRVGNQVARALEETPGSADVRVELTSGLPTLTVSVDRFAAA
ncbi:MAG: efflux RND transporter permease subunit, partial [Burkholderiaceae bacterium]